jgi:Putative porin
MLPSGVFVHSFGGFMKRWLFGLLVFSATSLAHAQQTDRPFVEKTNGFQMDALVRQEWTTKFFDTTLPTESRQRSRLMPRLIEGGDRFTIGVGGDFNLGSDKNTDPNGDGTKPLILRDNYKSRDARLDLAFVRIQPLTWLAVDGGRFAMPFGVTEMTWDKDLRLQGGAARLSTKAIGEIETLSIGGLYSQSSHVFDDGKAHVLVLNGTARFKAGQEASIELCGSLFDWKRLSDLEPMIRRQNSRDANGLVPDLYRTADIVGRIKVNGAMPLELVGDYAWNTKLSENNRGLWIAAILGNLTTSRARAEYTYAKIDKDAVVAAFNTDDFFWATGWQGHRLEVGTRVSDRMTAHAIGQIQRFKDSPNVAERDHYLQRFRLELRIKS